MGSADEEQGELPRDARPKRADERGEGGPRGSAAEPTGEAHANGTWRRWRWWLLCLVALFAGVAIALLSARRRPPAPPPVRDPVEIVWQYTWNMKNTDGPWFDEPTPPAPNFKPARSSASPNGYVVPATLDEAAALFRASTSDEFRAYFRTTQWADRQWIFTAGGNIGRYMPLVAGRAQAYAFEGHPFADWAGLFWLFEGSALRRWFEEHGMAERTTMVRVLSLRVLADMNGSAFDLRWASELAAGSDWWPQMMMRVAPHHFRGGEMSHER